MLTGVVLTFFIGYAIIVLEQPLRLDKSIPALLMGTITWALISVGQLEIMGADLHLTTLEEGLLHHLGKTAEILFFLLGAMTIVELVDLHKGFSPITNLVRTRNKRTLLWVSASLAFFLSAVLDNLTTTIVMVSFLRKLIPTREDRIYFVSLIIIAANAGGAWSPIGDVTTTMLWIGKKVTSMKLFSDLFLPSVFSLLLPLTIASFLPAFRGNVESDPNKEKDQGEPVLLSSKTMLIAGLAGLVFVPIFKSLTHLPPYMGIMISLGIVWLISEYIHPEENFNQENRSLYSVHKALSRIEISSLVFFLGILLAVGALESVVVASSSGEKMGFLMHTAKNLQRLIPDQNLVIILIGFLSAIIDNVPMVAAVMGMYPMDQFPTDNDLWHFIAYTAGTGGSMLIIGSAAGVAGMGMEKIDFIWYLKKVSWLALIGYLAGCFFFLIMA